MNVGYQLHSQSDTNYAKMKREAVFIICMSINYIIILYFVLSADDNSLIVMHIIPFGIVYVLLKIKNSVVILWDLFWADFFNPDAKI